MGWNDVILLLLSTGQVISSPGVSAALQSASDFDLESIHYNPRYLNDDEVNAPLQLEDLDDQQFEKLSNFLLKLLLVPWPNGVSPLVYVEEQESLLQESPDTSLDENEFREYDLRPNQLKRSKYYRKYPWKRQNQRYEPDNQYMCAPSKHDVMRLLVALHDARIGNREKLVDFCKRRRPASSVFTNVRFLGRRK